MATHKNTTRTKKRMKKYLKEIEISGMIILLIGVLLGHLVSMTNGAIAVGIGLLLWTTTVVIKAFNWEEYRRDNMMNIFIMMGACFLIILSMLFR